MIIRNEKGNKLLPKNFKKIFEFNDLQNKQRVSNEKSNNEEDQRNKILNEKAKEYQKNLAICYDSQIEELSNKIKEKKKKEKEDELKNLEILNKKFDQNKERINEKKMKIFEKLDKYNKIFTSFDSKEMPHEILLNNIDQFDNNKNDKNIIESHFMQNFIKNQKEIDSFKRQRLFENQKYVQKQIMDLNNKKKQDQIKLLEEEKRSINDLINNERKQKQLNYNQKIKTQKLLMENYFQNINMKNNRNYFQINKKTTEEYENSFAFIPGISNIPSVGSKPTLRSGNKSLELRNIILSPHFNNFSLPNI